MGLALRNSLSNLPAMKIVHAASELFPYLKTGGLADAVGALSTALAERGHQVSAFLPGDSPGRFSVPPRIVTPPLRCDRASVV